MQDNSIGIHTRFSGELAFQVWGAESLDENGNPLPGAKPKQELDYQPQMITDAFFETWLNGAIDTRADLFSQMGVGNGTTAAAATDTTISQIGTRFASFNSVVTYSVSGNEITQTNQYRTTQGQIIGTISEVGLFRNPTGGLTMMRSLIKDVGGTPTTLTLTSMDFLYVNWKVKSVVNLSDVTGVINLGGVNYNYVLRPCFWNSGLGTGNVNTAPFAGLCTTSNVSAALGFQTVSARPTQTLGSVTSTPGGGGFSGQLFSTNTYTAGTKQRKMTYKWNITEGNTGSGIGSVTLTNSISYAGYQVSFSAVSGGGTIPKDNTKELTLGFTFSYGR